MRLFLLSNSLFFLSVYTGELYCRVYGVFKLFRQNSFGRIVELWPAYIQGERELDLRILVRVSFFYRIPIGLPVRRVGNWKDIFGAVFCFAL